jgi:hypothetical protein
VGSGIGLIAQTDELDAIPKRLDNNKSESSRNHFATHKPAGRLSAAQRLIKHFARLPESLPG